MPTGSRSWYFDLSVHQLPVVARMQGLTYLASPLGDWLADMVEVQYTDRSPQEGSHVLTMPLIDAIHLLNLLEEMTQAQGLDHLRQPPREARH